jgi:hypothetical protein
MRTRTISNTANLTAIVLLAIGLTAPASEAEGPAPETVEAFNRYIDLAETRDRQQLADQQQFLWIDALPESQRQQTYDLLKRGQTVVQPSAGCTAKTCPVPDGLIHDWIGIVFVPGVSLAQTLATLQDYDHDADYYRPQVAASKLLSKTANNFCVFLRLKQTRMITVVLDTEYDVRYHSADQTHATSQSHSTSISEIENVGSPQEQAMPTGKDHGFLWRLNSYWHFYQSGGGVYIQCNAISLTRDIPPGLGWMVAPFIENISRDSLKFTLTATREALLKKFPGATSDKSEKRNEK